MPPSAARDARPDPREAEEHLLRLSEAIERFRAETDVVAKGAAASALTRAMADGLVAAKVLSRQTILEMQSSGMTLAEIGDVMGITRQRVYEISAGRAARRPSARQGSVLSPDGSTVEG